MEHPDKKRRSAQEEFLKSLIEHERAQHACLFRIENASYRYHRLADNYEPNEKDFRDWLEGLPKNIRKDMEMMGFELSKGVLSFTRYFNEKNDIGMDTWMKEHLTPEDLKFTKKRERDNLREHIWKSSKKSAFIREVTFKEKRV